MLKRWIATAIMMIMAVALADCQRQDDQKYLSIKGKIFIFNIRLARAFYELTLTRHEAVTDGSVVVARFENPAGGPPLVVSQKVFPKMTRIDLQSPDLSCIVKDRPYRIEIELNDPDGKVLQHIDTTLASTLDQTDLPATSLVTGPAYDRNKAAFGEDGKIRMSDISGCPK